jgi:hypothetical protein
VLFPPRMSRLVWICQERFAQLKAPARTRWHQVRGFGLVHLVSESVPLRELRWGEQRELARVVEEQAVLEEEEDASDLWSRTT